jgi:hypothetical protein
LRNAAASLAKVTDALAATPRAQLRQAMRESTSSSLLEEITEAQARYAQLHRLAFGQAGAALQETAAAGSTMAALREQANQGLRKLIKEGLLMDRSDFQAERAITRQALSKAQQERRLFHVEVDGERYFPSFFLDSSYDRTKLEAVSKVLGDLPGATKLHFFLQQRASLAGSTPLEAIASGNYQQVLSAAEALRTG